jgi:hypothetical protein
VIREVIDGQQRLRALLDFLKDEYALTKSIEKYGGKKFSQLPTEVQQKIEKFSFLCEVFQQISDKEVLEVFARVNTYAVALNEQELRNGRYFGLFKQSAYKLAHDHLEFWRKHKIFSESGIARMLEVELTSELLIASIAGQQDKKKSIDTFYGDYDEVFPEKAHLENRFVAVIDAISQALDTDLAETEFKRVPLFYTLFCVVYQRLFGLPGETLLTARKKRMSAEEGTRLKDAVIDLSDRLAAAKGDSPVAPADLPFINACLRQTDNIKPRQARFNRLYQTAF